ncbi:hypothetical protein [Nocardioides halotolerans]|uniref:hypothetical protein n=1 Tax=Nocardioides halotolerans TaxID=433660 RepID=UPI0003F6594D|nr:hypothetical protein [Nocardioides halotolerans]
MLSRIRAALVAVLVVGLLVSGYVGYRLFTEEPDREPSVSHVTGTTDDGWQLVTYRGVTVELPADWDRTDTTRCGAESERWGPAGHDPCSMTEGLWFRASATFDATVGPGVHTQPASDTSPDGGWGGYATRGDVVVDVAGTDEAVVRRILQSVSVPI